MYYLNTFVIILVSLILISNAVQIFLLVKRNKKVKNDTTDWVQGYHHGTGFAVSCYKKLLNDLKNQKPISLHNVEVLYRRISEEINKHNPQL